MASTSATSYTLFSPYVLASDQTGKKYNNQWIKEPYKIGIGCDIFSYGLKYYHIKQISSELKRSHYEIGYHYIPRWNFLENWYIGATVYQLGDKIYFHPLLLGFETLVTPDSVISGWGKLPEAGGTQYRPIMWTLAIYYTVIAIPLWALSALGDFYLNVDLAFTNFNPQNTIGYLNIGFRYGFN